MRRIDHLRQIFAAALRRVDPYATLKRCVRLEGGRLVAIFADERTEIDLAPFSRVLVLGCGKAAGRMALALEEILGDRLSGGFVCTKYGHAERLSRIEIAEAGHPLPDEAGVAAAERMAGLARGADAQTFVITVISGGGSALLPAPMIYRDGGREVRLTLGQLRETTEVLLSCGAEIGEVNCLRKHLSTLKGGRFLRLLAPAASLSLMLSDVVGDRPDAIASGLTAADGSTYARALAIVEKYGVATRLPREVLRAFELGAAGEIPETLKAGDPALARTGNLLIGTNRAAVLAACAEARSLGYAAAPLTSRLVGEARVAAGFLCGVARDARDFGLLVRPPACIVAGGETTVTLRGAGRGGRNQELALAFLDALADDPRQGSGINFLSASTDGSDGPTDAAGAFVAEGAATRAAALGLSVREALAANDSYGFFEALGGLCKTGPTRTNVCDLQIALVE